MPWDACFEITWSMLCCVWMRVQLVLLFVLSNTLMPEHIVLLQWLGCTVRFNHTLDWWIRIWLIKVKTARLLCLHTDSTKCVEAGCMTDGMSTACYALIPLLLIESDCHVLAGLGGHNFAMATLILLLMNTAVSARRSHNDDKHSNHNFWSIV